MEPWQILRAARRRRRLNQRELAAVAGVPPSTVSRIEARLVVPRYATMQQILSSVGFDMVVVETHPRGFRPKVYPLLPDAGQDAMRDRLGGRFPPYARSWQIEHDFDGWWGWGRLAWSMRDKKVPKYTFIGRRRWYLDSPGRFEDVT